jgi:hypothetical protein
MDPFARIVIMNLKSHLLISGTMLALLAASTNSTASTLITFDDLNPGTGSFMIPNGYQGFQWSNFAVTNGAQFSAHDNAPGFVNGVVSGSNVAFNADARDASFGVINGSTFTLTSLYLTQAGFGPGNSTEIVGFRGGVAVDSAIFTPSANSPTLETLNWAGLDTVTLYDIWPPTGSDIAVVDNILINGPSGLPAPSLVPEPSPFALYVAAGLVGLTYRRVRRKRVTAGVDAASKLAK